MDVTYDENYSIGLKAQDCAPGSIYMVHETGRHSYLCAYRMPNGRQEKFFVDLESGCLYSAAEFPTCRFYEVKAYTRISGREVSGCEARP